MLFFLMATEGDPQAIALADYYTEHKNVLYSTALQILRDPYLAEDAIQETFINLYRYQSAFTKVPENKRKGYLLTMVRNQCYTFLKKADRERDLTEKTALDAEPDFLGYFDVEEIILAGETKERLAKAMRKLNDVQQEILICRYYYDLSGQEIADMLGISVGSVWSRLHRAMKKLGEIMREESDNDEYVSAP